MILEKKLAMQWKWIKSNKIIYFHQICDKVDGSVSWVCEMYVYVFVAVSDFLGTESGLCGLPPDHWLSWSLADKSQEINF